MTDTQSSADVRPATVAEKNKQEWNALVFTGDAPFDDGATPEVVAKKTLLLQQHNAKKEKAKSKVQLRQELIAATPLLRIAKAIAQYAFVEPLTETEQKRVLVLRDSKRGPNGPPLRRDCQRTLMIYFRAVFYHKGGIYVPCVKRSCFAGDVMRIADLTRYITWKYRKPGYLDIPITDEFLNFSMARVESDYQCETGLVKLIEEYRDELLLQGVFSEDPISELAPSAPVRQEKRFRIHTIAKRMDEINARMDEMAEQRTADRKALVEMLGICTRLMARVTELENRSVVTTPIDAAKNIQEVVVPSGPVVQ